MIVVEEKGIAKRSLADIKNDLMTFFTARIKHLLSEKEVRYDLVDAVLGGTIGNVSSLVNRALVLEQKKNEETFKETMEALSRVMNIAVKLTDAPKIKEELFENDFETKLYTSYKQVVEQFEATEDVSKRFDLLASLKTDIENYFENTMVMAEDEAVRFNRLSLMKEISGLIGKFAHMNKVLSL